MLILMSMSCVFCYYIVNVVVILVIILCWLVVCYIKLHV